MRVGVVGTGRMGRLVSELARERGHEVALELGAEDNPEGAGLSAARLQGLDVVIEFTVPSSARENLRRCVEAGVSVVSGTTGWHDASAAAELEELAARSGAGVLVAPNFAIGVHLFRRIVQRAAELASGDELFDLWIEEAHHRGKADWPSGTALALANDVLERWPSKTRLRRGLPEGAVANEELCVSSSRGGHEPGLHRVVIDAPDETIELLHRARSRRVFASGAVRAAEWLSGRSGVHTLTDFLEPEELRS